jgi:DNA gyrase/topoisomerase IV subunit A
MTGLELIDAFIDRRLESLASRPEPAALQLAWEQAHLQEGLCVALRALEDVLAALGQAEAQRALTVFERPTLRAAVRTLQLRSSNDYARGFTEAQARHLIATSDLTSRRLADEDARWLRLRAELDVQLAHPVSRTPRARLRRHLLELRERFDQPRQTQLVETLS